MELNLTEALRYLGIVGQAPESVQTDAAAMAQHLMNTVEPRYTYRI